MSQPTEYKNRKQCPLESCGTFNDPDANFCESCGTPLDASGSAAKTVLAGHDTNIEAGTAASRDTGPGGQKTQVWGGSAAPELELVLLDENGQESFCLSVTGEHTIGRSDAELTVPESYVSRRHCVVRVVGDRVELIDDGSTNGTFLKLRDQDQMVQPGDEYLAGSTLFRIEKRSS